MSREQDIPEKRIAATWDGEPQCEAINDATLADVEGWGRCLFVEGHAGAHSFDVPMVASDD